MPTVPTMTMLHIILLISLFTTGITTTPYCDQKLQEEKKIVLKNQHPCGLPPPDNCCFSQESHFDQSPSGVYKMNNWCSGRLSVVDMYCDTITADGGWTVIQRRKDGSENFNRPWTDYEKGFGGLNGEFWYGLKVINCLTQSGQWELRVDFEFPNKTRSYLHYNMFRVGSASEEYPLTISGFSGITPTDPFSTSVHNNQKFTSKDNDNDKWSGNCATHPNHNSGKGNGGWWYTTACWNINLNENFGSPYFLHLAGKWYSTKQIEMKIRPLNCTPQ